jgi:hypothetical protein
MPDKRKPCGKNCLRCWRNKLKHANPQSKAYLIKLNNKSNSNTEPINETDIESTNKADPWEITGEEKQRVQNRYIRKLKDDDLIAPNKLKLVISDYVIKNVL